MLLEHTLLGEGLTHTLLLMLWWCHDCSQGLMQRVLGSTTHSQLKVSEQGG